MDGEWIVGSRAITAYLQKGCWKTTKSWIKRYNAPMRRLIDDRPAFLRSELNTWLINTSNEITTFKTGVKKSKTDFKSINK
jgi:hypothetical protein